MRRVDEPRDVDDDDVAERESNEKSCLNGVVPVLERGVDGKQYEYDEIENPVESLLEHHDSVIFYVFHVDSFEKLFLART